MKRKKLLLLTTALLLLTGCMRMMPKLDETYLQSMDGVNADAEHTTIRILLFGETSGLEPVLDELHRQMDADQLGLRMDITTVPASEYVSALSLKLQSREDLDLVFNAPWMNLGSLIDSGMCMDLSSFFNNSAYPGLEKAFPADYIEANKFYRRVYAVPITNAYHDPLGIYYRKDLLRSAGLGFDTITNEEELLAFYEAALQLWPELSPLSLGNRGFHTMTMNDMYFRTKNVYDIPGWPVWDYPGKIVLDATGEKVLDAVFAGDELSRFQQLGFTTDLLSDFLVKNAAYAKYTQSSSMLSTSQDQLFFQGKSLSMEGELSACSLDVQDRLRRLVPDAEVAFWSYEWIFAEENRGVTAIPSMMQAWNFLCVPSYSPKTSQAMRLLDWLYSDRNRLELLSYGLPDVDWQPMDEDSYVLLQPEGRDYQFPAYEMTWSPIYNRIRSGLPDSERELTQYVFDNSNYAKVSLSGWTLNTTAISIEIAQLNALYRSYAPAFKHGAFGDLTDEKIMEMHEKSRELGLETIRQEIIRQAQYYLDTD